MSTAVQSPDEHRVVRPFRFPILSPAIDKGPHELLLRFCQILPESHKQKNRTRESLERDSVRSVSSRLK
jgi:hypothetical protein